MKKWIARFRLVSPFWLFKLYFINLFSKKIKIGIGPVITAEAELGNRKFHIDPIVNAINEYSSKYVCNIFFADEEASLQKYDVLVITRYFNFIKLEHLRKIQSKSVLIIYRALDDLLKHELDLQVNVYDTWDDAVDQYPEFISSMDGVLAANPIQRNQLAEYNENAKTVLTPVIMSQHKAIYSKACPVKLVWQGYYNTQFLGFIDKVGPVLERLNDEAAGSFELILNMDRPGPEEEYIRNVKWSIKNWQKAIVEADIAVTFKSQEIEMHCKKPASKVIQFMAAGLPVISTPSEADKLVITHGKTGFFAYDENDWYEYLKKLIFEPELRERTGRAAREYAINHFSAKTISEEYIKMIEQPK